MSLGESIQAALDAAVPGDSIVLQAGTYQEVTGSTYGLHVTTDNLTLTGDGMAPSVSLLPVANRLDSTPHHRDVTSQIVLVRHQSFKTLSFSAFP